MASRREDGLFRVDAVSIVTGAAATALCPPECARSCEPGGNCLACLKRVHHKHGRHRQTPGPKTVGSKWVQTPPHTHTHRALRLDAE